MTSLGPLAVGAAGMLVVYRQGLRLLPRHHRPRVRDVAIGLSGLAATFVAAAGFDALARSDFVWHMVQHQLLVLVAAPLIAIADPVRVWWRALVQRPLLRPRGPYVVVVAGVVHVGTLVVWHLPPAYDAAMASPPVHFAEHASLLLTGVALWTLVHWERDRGGIGGPVIALVLVAVTGAAVGVALLTAPQVLYEAFRQDAGAHTQQQVGGALMKVSGLAVHGGSAVGLVARWFRRLDLADGAAGARRAGTP